MVCNGIFVIDGLGWVEEMMGWVGLGYENWTHGHVCANVHWQLLATQYVITDDWITNVNKLTDNKNLECPWRPQSTS